MSGSTISTRGVRVEVEPHYLAAHSDPARHHWMHAYTVTITNDGDVPVRLVSRHWIITNARGTEEHVRGAGVVGEQPLLRPGQAFRYTSGCPMDTAVGTMHGTYQMVREDGEGFEADVAPFTLAEPFAVN
jgi:ApaG protein